MRIVEIIPQLSSGGGERFVVDLCNELSVHHEVKLIVFYPFNSPEKAFYLSQLSERVTVVTLNKRPGIDIGLISHLHKEISKWAPDVIHSHLRAITYLAPLSLGKDKIMRCHTVHSSADKEAIGFSSAQIRRWLFKTHRFIPVTISEESRRSFIDFYGMDAPMIYNGRNIPKNINISDDVCSEFMEYRGKENKRVLVNLANFSNVKRQGMIARICKRLEDEGYKFTMLLIGRNTGNEELEKVNAVGCMSLKVLGAKTNPLEYLTLADAYCLLSSYEGMPISLIEALGCSAVPVCTPVGGIVDVIKDGVNGILASTTDENECYDAVKRFLELSDEQLNKMKSEAYSSYAPFSMTDCANKYVELFNSVLNDKS